MPCVFQFKKAQASTNDYVSLLKVKLGGISKASVIITNSAAANVITYQMLYSNDELAAAGSWYQKSTSDVNAYGTDPTKAVQADIDPTPAWIDIQIKSKVTDTHGTGNAWLKAVGL